MKTTWGVIKNETGKIKGRDTDFKLELDYKTLNEDTEFGFTRGRSTIDAGVELVQHIFGAWEDSRDAIGIFCDLSKAFDCVYHETLIGKPRHYGVTGRALDLLKSYLSNRVQRVNVNVRNKELEFVNSTVFLEITLDNRLQWGPHISMCYRICICKDIELSSDTEPLIGTPDVQHGRACSMLIFKDVYCIVFFNHPLPHNPKSDTLANYSRFNALNLEPSAPAQCGRSPRTTTPRALRDKAKVV
ncbi:Probable RNA-directed DNA polymerase from transposon BS [Eumeta japonica]|uniref:Probable RNA-directed DNA polymerase from transposon BS n=1 Tax=Eumeta variegata TaxID=151549 RepID=A0A4C1SWY2_EUMVA|nr:Probable RNA-directed DNA polymerase from transposon BS [Eumeta japonica]